jgi:hypothetical protein
MKKAEKKQEIIATPPILPPEFQAMMQKVATTPKEEVDKAIAADKKAKRKRKDC